MFKDSHNKQHQDGRKTIIILRAMMLFIIFTNAFQQSVLSETNPPATSTISPDEARKANDEAQAEYYRAQIEKLKQTPPSRTFWQAITDNPASVLGVIGVLVAALVTLLSFFFNYRATLRNQRDTQFYEALKRFGDHDSPAMRSSAVGLLAQMARTKQLGVKSTRTFQRDRTYFFILTWRRPYLDTVLTQLVTGLLLEQNRVVLASISGALRALSWLDPNQVVAALYWANQRLQEDLVNALAEFSAAKESDQLGDAWSLAESFTGYKEEVLRILAAQSDQDFPTLTSSALRAYTAMPAGEKQEQLIALQHDLRIATQRLRANIDACSKAMAFLRPERQGILQRLWWKRIGTSSTYFISLKKLFLVNADLRYARLGRIGILKSLEVDMPGVQLQGANLHKATLEGLNLRGAQLQGTNLANTGMDGTKLFGARVDEKTNMDGATWWKANFFGYVADDFFEDERTDVIDTHLLEELFDRYGSTEMTDLHYSVRKFRENSSPKTEPRMAEEVTE